jgi:hypothetical protein
MWKVSRILTCAATLVVLSNCSSPRIGELQPLPKDLPGELRKFAVVEPVRDSNSPPSPIPLVKGKKKHAVKKAKEPDVPPAFVYPNRRSKIDPIWVGEQQVLEVTYIGIKAGDFTMDVLPTKQIAGRTVYHLHATAVSSSMMNLFYSLNDSIESFLDYESLFSHRFHLELDQTKQKRDSLELYDSETKKTFYWDRRNHVEKGISEIKETFDFPEPFPQDSFGALFYIRTMPLEEGKIFTFPVVSEGKEWDAIVTVIRHEMMDTPLGKKSCFVGKIQTRYQGVMKQENGDSLIWLTDDDRRFIVRLEAHIKVGAVVAQLKHVELGEKPNAQ